MRKLLLSIVLMFSLVTILSAQTVVRGKVTAASDGLPLPGVNVTVKGGTVGTLTNAQGEFQITVPAAFTRLVFRYIGFLSSEAAVQDVMNVVLQQDVKQLSEVVVVGYGTQNVRELTGAVGRLNTAAIKDAPVLGIDQGMQGRIAGVQVTQNSGTPGAGISVRIRGASSISASNQPLYIVDGVPLITGDFSQLGYGGQTVNALSDINPNDIESLEVLKDASAAAIYGSRAANGVVLITTKRGTAAKTKVSFSSYYGTQSPWKKVGFLDRPQYLDLMKEAFINDGFFTGKESRLEVVDYYYGVGSAGFLSDTTINTNWLDEVFKTAGMQNYELSVSGGDSKTKFFVSGGYYDQQGIVLGSNYDRLSGRLNLDHVASDKFSVGGSLSSTRSLNTRIVGDNTVVGGLPNAMASSPIFPVRFNGQYTRPNFFYTNPVAEATENDDDAINIRSQGNVYGKYAIIPGLTLNGRVGVDIFNLNETRYTPANYPGSGGAAVLGRATNARTTATKTLLETYLELRKGFGDHSLNAVAGTSREKNAVDASSVTGEGFAGEKFRFVSSAAKVNAGSNSITANLLTSFFGRVNYSFKERYLFNFNIRADGSSRFGANNRYGYFPSVSAGWRLNEESFLKDKEWLSNLKLRASYGLVGNQEIGNFNYLSLFSGSNYLDQAGIAPSQLGNPDLKWENTRQTDIGLDLGLFNNRITLGADYYYKKTTDLLFARPISGQNGFTSVSDNVGEVENKGLEFSLSTLNLTGTDGGFKWSTDFNISLNRNKVLKLYEGKDIFYGFGGNSIILREGQPIGTFYGLIADGVYSKTSDVPAARAAKGIKAGDMNYRDVNGDGVITDSDFTITGNAQPKFTGGITNAFSFKGIDLNVFAQFSAGNDIWDAAGNYQQGLFGNFFDDNQRSSVLARWKKEGDVTTVPRATTDVSANRNNLSNSTRFIEDGSYLRLKNVVLGYTIPKSFVNRYKINNLRLFVQAQNLLTLTNYSGFDPEVNFAGASNTTLGVDFYTYPQARTFTFGLNLGL